MNTSCRPAPSSFPKIITPHDRMRGAGAWVVQQKVNDGPWEPTEWYYGRGGVSRLKEWDNSEPVPFPPNLWFYPDLIEELRALTRNLSNVLASYSRPTLIEFRGYNLMTQDMCYLGLVNDPRPRGSPRHTVVQVRWVAEILLDEKWAYVRKVESNGHILSNYNFEECFVHEFEEAIKLAKRCDPHKTARIREIETDNAIMACIL